MLYTGKDSAKDVSTSASTASVDSAETAPTADNTVGRFSSVDDESLFYKNDGSAFQDRLWNGSNVFNKNI